MPRSADISTQGAKLRRRAEDRLRKGAGIRKLATVVPESEAETHRLLHELQVHHVELEMQNAELHEARDRMEELVEKYTDLYDFAPVGYFSLNEKGLIVEGNLMGAALLGVERSRLVNRSLSRFVAPASQPDFLELLKRVFAGTGKQHCDAALIKDDGAVFWARIRGTSAVSLTGPGKWCRVAVSDITSLKHAEEQLRQNEALFSALVQQAPVGLYVVDDQLRLQQLNARARPVFKNVRPLQGRSFSELLRLIWPEKIADEVFGLFRRTLKTGEPYHSRDFSERRRDTGVMESYEWQLQRITLPEGRLGVVCFFDNITERKKVEATQLRNEVLAATNRKLEKEIVRRRLVEDSLKQSEEHLNRLLEQAHHMHAQLRQLSHQIIEAQEEERKRISRELHDEIAQILVGINVRLETLAHETTADPRVLKKRIALTQRLVEKSVNTVHRFARELRPTVLDDLGLIPALHSYMKEFMKRTKVRIKFTAFAEVEKLGNARRTVLYRVAQSALTNIAQHARATHVEVSIHKVENMVRMEVHDNGRSFEVGQVLFAKRRKRLGLLGMRERVEMVGGRFSVDSAPGKGTTIRAQIPFTLATKRRIAGGNGNKAARPAG